MVNSYIFVNGVEIYRFHAKDFPVNAAPSCLGNFSKVLSVYMKKSGLCGHVYHFSVDYDSTDVADILDIHKYLMAENNIK